MESYHNSSATAIFVDNHVGHKFFPFDPDAGLHRACLNILSACGGARILCSAGGLIFYRKRVPIYNSIGVCNPVRREPRLIIHIPPDDDGGIAPFSSLAVEFADDGDGVTRDYKLVYLTPGSDWSNLYRCRVYDSAARVWTRDEMIHHGGRNLQFDNPAVHRGTVFWASDCYRYVTVDPYVMSYEIATGAIKFLAMPDDGAVESADNISVAVWEESWLCLVHYRRSSGTFTAWRWCADSDSWAKVNELVYLEKAAESVGTMMVCDGGKEKGMVLVFSVKEEAYVYSFRQRDVTTLTKRTGSHFPTFTAYANTLRPC